MLYCLSRITGCKIERFQTSSEPIQESAIDATKMISKAVDDQRPNNAESASKRPERKSFQIQLI
jgi:hypothetical protein